MSGEQSDGVWDNFYVTSREEATAHHIVYEPGRKRARGNKPMQRTIKRNRKVAFAAYDLETTNIAAGTPTILYLTAYQGGLHMATPPRMRVSEKVARGTTQQENLTAFRELLERTMLTKEHNRKRYIAWNGNKYDALLVALALLTSDDWVIHPYLTKSNAVRGMKIEGVNDKAGLSFEFLDGLAMTGLDTVGTKLSKFLNMFAPSHMAKLDLNFEETSFDPDNPEHVAYADRDSEGLYWAMVAVNEKVVALTGNELQPTLGRAAIQYFMSQMPEGVQVWRPNDELFKILHEKAKRGGYVWIQRRYSGPVWKYDLNQAYAGAMRDCDLPCGQAVNVSEYQPGKCGVYRCMIWREQTSPVPFYFKDAETGAAGFTNGRAVETWILSTELEHLRRDGWAVDVSDGWYWTDSFRMAEFVTNLERMRFTDPEGPSGPLGTIIKVFGNGSYGKTLELLDGISLVMAKICPQGMTPYEPDTAIPIFADVQEPIKAQYHQPQIGCFITAHVRIQVREGALAMPDAFLYADTDCLVFSREAKHLDIDARRYGAWKAESQGVKYLLIGKKVYWGEDGTQHAKGLRIRELSAADFAAWYEGKPPSQTQLQRVNFIKMVAGADMFRYLKREGTDVKKLKTVKLDGDLFLPV